MLARNSQAGIGNRSLTVPLALAGIALLVAAATGLSGSARGKGTSQADPRPRVQASPSPTTEPAERPAPLKAEPDVSLRRLTGAVGPDLSQALRSAGAPDGIAREYVRQVTAAVDLNEGLSVVDRFDLVLATAPGLAPILVYAGLDRVGRSDVQLFKWSDSKELRWLDASGLGRDERGLVSPANGRVTSRFGGRMHPMLGYLRFHRGVDLAAKAGTPVIAAAAGRVVAAGWRGGYGRQVLLAHENAVQSSYAHLSRIVAQPGHEVRRGQVIGYVGSSGLSTGPHLHFEVLRNGRAIDPLTAHISTPIALHGEQLHAYHDQLRYVLTLPHSGS